MIVKQLQIKAKQMRQSFSLNKDKYHAKKFDYAHTLA
jgi:hypothetical protein